MNRILSGVIVAGVVSLALPAAAAVDAYLKLDGIDGGKIALSGLAYGSGRPIESTPPGVGPDRRALNTMVAVKPVDAASRALWQAAASGRRFPTAYVYFRPAAGAAYRGYRLTDVVLSGFDPNSHHAGPAQTTERFTLNFAQMVAATPNEGAGAPEAR
jgi:type VI protein secretion system component Hcp